MKPIFLVTFFCTFLISCTTAQNGCVEQKCVDTEQAVTLDSETQKLYLDAGYRIPTFIPPLIFPEELRIQGLQSTLVLALDIDREGNVTTALIQSSSGARAFDKYAIEYVKQFKFESSHEPTKNQLQRVTYSIK